MKKILALSVLSLALFACERQDRQSATEVSEDVDNSGQNVRDRDSRTKTPLDQSETEVDRITTQKIRRALISDSTLSVNAKNIKVMTIDGVVTLRGPVANVQEKELIARKASEIQGVTSIDNQLEVIRNP